MVKATLFNDDIDVYISQEEACCLGQIEIKDGKVQCIPLEVILQNSSLRLVIHKQNFDNSCDGIEVERTDYGFFVRINFNAFNFIVDNETYGTRYDGSNKITFVREGACEKF